MNEFSDAPAQRLLEGLKDAFAEDVFHRRKKFILFVCGGPLDPLPGENPSLRRQFRDWSERELTDFIVVLAEEAFNQTRSYRLTRAVNLARFEAVIGQVADVVVIFPESPGSYSEVGFFSNSHAIPAKTIVANDKFYRAEPSFLNFGPLRSIDAKSIFSPRIDVSTADPTEDFGVIKKKLNDWRIHQKRQRFTYAPYKQLDLKERLSVVLELLHLLRLVTLKDLRYAVKQTFGPASLDSVGQILAVLKGAGYVTEVDDRFALAKHRETLLEFDVVSKKEQLIARVTEYYQSHRPELYDAVRAWVSS
jgi:hypothetical protein